MDRRKFIRNAAGLLIAAPAIIRPDPADAWLHGSALTLAQLQANFIGMKWGLMYSMGIPTYLDVEVTTPKPVNTWAPAGAINLDAWIAVAVAAKAKYVVIVAKHHDGFCLWPTATTTYNISSTAWWAANGQPDLLLQFCTKARAAGLAVIIYCSVRDASADGGNPPANPTAFRAFLEAQYTELATLYGKITGFWLDGAEWWYGSSTPWPSSTVRNNVLRAMQSNILVIDNSHTGADSDIIEFEGALPANGNTVPSEAVQADTTTGTYFWKSPAAGGNPLLSSSTILATIALCNARAANLLMNVSPDRDGVIPSDQVTLMTTVGASL